MLNANAEAAKKQNIAAELKPTISRQNHNEQSNPKSQPNDLFLYSILFSEEAF